MAAARAEGLDLTADRYPYTAASTDLDYILPEWLSEGGISAEMDRLKSEVVRERLRVYMADLAKTTPNFWRRVIVSRTCSGLPLTGRAGGRVAPEGQSLEELSRLTGRQPWQLVVELLVRDGSDVVGDDPLAVLSVPSDLAMEAAVLPMHGVRVRVGLRADVYLDAPDGPKALRVDYLLPHAEPNTGATIIRWASRPITQVRTGSRPPGNTMRWGAKRWNGPYSAIPPGNT